MSIVVVDYGAGNLRSAAKALERAAREAGLAMAVEVTSDPDRLARAERIVLPGDGAFPDCRRGLAAVPGLTEALGEAVLDRAIPFLGICIGMQLMASRGWEYEETEGLNWIPGEVVRIAPSDSALKVPHMGWNTLERRREHALVDGIPLGEEGLHAYFLHAYHMRPEDEADILATASYGGPVTAIVARANMAGTQFHPEKSQRLGLALLGNFLKWRP